MHVPSSELDIIAEPDQADTGIRPVTDDACPDKLCNAGRVRPVGGSSTFSKLGSSTITSRPTKQGGIYNIKIDIYGCYLIIDHIQIVPSSEPDIRKKSSRERAKQVRDL